MIFRDIYTENYPDSRGIIIIFFFYLENSNPLFISGAGPKSEHQI